MRPPVGVPLEAPLLLHDNYSHNFHRVLQTIDYATQVLLATFHITQRETFSPTPRNIEWILVYIYYVEGALYLDHIEKYVRYPSMKWHNPVNPLT